MPIISLTHLPGGDDSPRQLAVAPTNAGACPYTTTHSITTENVVLAVTNLNNDPLKTSSVSNEHQCQFYPQEISQAMAVKEEEEDTHNSDHDSITTTKKSGGSGGDGTTTNPTWKSSRVTIQDEVSSDSISLPAFTDDDDVLEEEDEEWTGGIQENCDITNGHAVGAGRDCMKNNIHTTTSANAFTNPVVSASATAIISPNEYDVLFVANDYYSLPPDRLHAGNKLYRQLIQESQEFYNAPQSTRKNKTTIIRNIIQIIKGKGGRFLCHNKTLINKGIITKTWTNVTNDLRKISNKIGHSLRNYMPEEGEELSSLPLLSSLPCDTPSSLSSVKPTPNECSGNDSRAEPELSSSHYTIHDVIGGQNLYQSNPGNIHYNQLIQQHWKQNYEKGKDKSDIISMIVKPFERLDPPGRFLKPCNDGQFEILSRQEIWVKIQKAFRKFYSGSRPDRIKPHSHDVKFDKDLCLLSSENDDGSGNAWLQAKIEQYVVENEESHSNNQNHKKHDDGGVELEILHDLEKSKYPPPRFLRVSCTKAGEWEMMSMEESKARIKSLLNGGDSSGNESSYGDGIHCENDDSNYSRSCTNCSSSSGKSKTLSNMPVKSKTTSKRRATTQEIEEETSTTTTTSGTSTTISDVEESLSQQRHAGKTNKRVKMDDGEAASSSSSAAEEETYQHETNERKCIRQLRDLSIQGMLSGDRKKVIYFDMILRKYNRRGQTISLVEVAHKMLFFDREDEDIAQSEFADQCEEITSYLLSNK